ncbi:MAG: outer membrane protein transport protein [candidate division Zixibacteria bacterium]|nr:outer membrane protein transport protein [candidate division Zixibacteria bacterium]
MGIRRIAVASVLALALLGSSALAAGFANTGVGLKARAMGGAFRAVADDWSAAMYNPAGYAFLKDNQLGGNAAFMHLRNDMTPNYRLGGEYEVGVFNDVTLYNQHEILSNPSAGIVFRLPVWGETVFGLSAYQRFDYNISWTAFSPLRAYNDSVDSYLPADQYRNNLDVVTFQLTAAREFIPEKLSIGIGLQLLRGDLVFNNVNFRTTPMTEEPWVDEPYRNVPELSRNDGNGWGFGLNLGMLYKLDPKTHLALTLDVPFDIDISGDARLDFILPKINALLIPGSPVGPGTLGYLFANGDNIDLPASFETTLKLPPTVGFGLSREINEKLTVALDAEYTFWSRFTGFEFTYSGLGAIPPITDDPATGYEFFSAPLESRVEFRNTTKIAGGVSYDALTYLTLFGGLSFDQGASRDGVAFIPQFADTGDKIGVSGGLQFHVQRWDLGIATAYTKYDDATITSMDKDLDGVLEGFPGDFTAKTYETILSFNYRF